MGCCSFTGEFGGALPSVEIWSVDFLGAMFACGYSGVRVAAFFEKLAHSFIRSDEGLTLETSAF